MSDWSQQLAADLPQTASVQPDWFSALRESAAQQFRRHGLPSRKDEAWKYTGLFKLEQQATRLAGSGDDDGLPAISFEPVDGLQVQTLAEALGSDNPQLQALLKSLPTSSTRQPSTDGFSLLNTATLENAYFIRVAAGVDGGRISLDWAAKTAGSAQLFNSRICVLLEAGAKLELLEQHSGSENNTDTNNIVLQVELADAASLQHIRIQQASEQAGLITRTDVAQQAGSEYFYYGFDLGGGLVRHDLHSRLLGSGARASLNGVYLLDGKRHVDNHAKVDHMALDGYSEQYFRGVAGGSSKAVFNTAVYVHEGADGTEAKQSNANILLSKRAEIDTKPELEIYADDVIASHGATVGQLDEQAVFYMRSRGLSDEQSRQMLTAAFCRSVSDKLPDRALAESISERMMDVMPQAG